MPRSTCRAASTHRNPWASFIHSSSIPRCSRSSSLAVRYPSSFKFPTSSSATPALVRAETQGSQLPVQVVGQRARGRQKMLKRRLVVLLKGRRTAKPGIQVILKVAPEVDFLERILLHPLAFSSDLLRGTLPVALPSGSLFKRFYALVDLLQHRIFDQFIRDHVLELKIVQRKNAHHLHQTGGKHLALRELYIQSGL